MYSDTYTRDGWKTFTGHIWLAGHMLDTMFDTPDLKGGSLWLALLVAVQCSTDALALHLVHSITSQLSNLCLVSSFNFSHWRNLMQSLQTTPSSNVKTGKDESIEIHFIQANCPTMDLIVTPTEQTIQKWHLHTWLLKWGYLQIMPMGTVWNNNYFD